MYLEITEIDLSIKLLLEGFLKRCGVEFYERNGECGYDVIFAMSEIKMLVGSDDVMLVGVELLNFIIIDRDKFLHIKIQ